MANLLTPATQAAIKAALQNVVDTFFRETVTLNIKTTVPDQYGENAVSTVVAKNFDVLIDKSVGKSGRYEDIDNSALGQRDESSWTLYFWNDDIVAAGVTQDDAEHSTITVNGKEYEIRLFTPTALFSDLGFLLWDCELKIYGG